MADFVLCPTSNQRKFTPYPTLTRNRGSDLPVDVTCDASLYTTNSELTANDLNISQGRAGVTISPELVKFSS